MSGKIPVVNSRSDLEYSCKRAANPASTKTHSPVHRAYEGWKACCIIIDLSREKELPVLASVVSGVGYDIQALS